MIPPIVNSNMRAIEVSVNEQFGEDRIRQYNSSHQHIIWTDGMDLSTGKPHLLLQAGDALI